MRKNVALIFSLVLMFSFTSTAYAASTKRLAGETRYDTATSIAQAGWEQSDYAILAYGENFPDALSAAPLSINYNAPILLTSGDDLPTVTKVTLVNLQVKYVLIIGGTGVIPSSIDGELQSMNIDVTRIAGQDRYDTAIRVAELLPSPTEIFVVTGEDYPDALSVAPIAALKQEPIILVPKNHMPDSVKSYLSENSITKTYIVGDSDIISDTLLNQFPGSERIIGDDKYVRNINVNSKFDNVFSSSDLCIATGEGFADALTGSAYAAKNGLPIVLVNDNLSTHTRMFTVNKLNIANKNDGHVNVFGGQAVVPDRVITYLYTLPNQSSSKPTAPTNLVATALSSSEITVQWDAINDVDYYFIYFSLEDKAFIPSLNSHGNPLQYKWLPGYSFKLFDIDPDTTVHFKVRAVKNGVVSDYSDVVSASTSKL